MGRPQQAEQMAAMSVHGLIEGVKKDILGRH